MTAIGTRLRLRPLGEQPVMARQIWTSLSYQTHWTSSTLLAHTLCWVIARHSHLPRGGKNTVIELLQWPCVAPV